MHFHPRLKPWTIFQVIGLLGYSKMDNLSQKYNSGELSVEEYWKNVKLGFQFYDKLNGCDGIEAYIEEVMDICFWNLNSFNHSEPFWSPGNKQATFHKLDEFVDIMIERNIEMVSAAWCGIFIGVLYSSPQQFNLKYWKTLRDNDQLNIEWMIKLMWNATPDWGLETADKLAGIIKSLNIASEVETSLEKISYLITKDDLYEFKEWVNIVRKTP